MSKPIAVVTGASGDIGRAIAELLDVDYDVVRGYHKTPIPGGRQIDVTNIISIMDAVKSIESNLALWVNCAGYLRRKVYQDILRGDWEYTLEVNAYGTFMCCQQAMMAFKARGANGCIINIASSGGQTGGMLAVHYAAAKAAVISLTKSFARIGAPKVRVNCVSPGLVEGKMSRAEIESPVGRKKINEGILLRRAGQPIEVARAVISLAHNEYVTGQVWNVNGGLFMG